MNPSLNTLRLITPTYNQKQSEGIFTTNVPRCPTKHSFRQFPGIARLSFCYGQRADEGEYRKPVKQKFLSESPVGECCIFLELYGICIYICLQFQVRHFRRDDRVTNISKMQSNANFNLSN
jgi:hypothetical protein